VAPFLPWYEADVQERWGRGGLRRGVDEDRRPDVWEESKESGELPERRLDKAGQGP